ncbi:MAG: cytochrome c maturation protein CcmE, partial [Acidobacteriia bacterium]|nr:cytochrome c maturation protein CcmE [Terriglobia bacterium]
LDVKRGNSERKIHFDSSTQWTKGKKPIDMSEFKEGSDVICLGKYDEKDEFHATRIDLRR